MKATIRPEFTLLAVEREHRVHCMFELTVPAGRRPPRVPLQIALVIDRSGSMAGAKLDNARRCAAWLGERLAPGDELALIDFDDRVRLRVPRGPVDQARLRAALDALRPGGTTNLSGGWLKGVEQLRAAANGGACKVLLLTDGVANAGITDGEALGALARGAAGEGVGTTTIGFGDDFDEDLLTAMAAAGGGNAHWAETPDAVPAIFAREFDGLARLVAQNVSVEIRPSAEVEVLGVLNEYPQIAVAGGVQVELGDAYGGETRRVVFELQIPHLAELGPVPVAELVLRYAGVGGPVALHESRIPLVVNAVSATEAADAAGDAGVREQVIVLAAARAREEAIRRSDAGDPSGAAHALRAVAGELRRADTAPELAAASTAQAELLEGEAVELSAGYTAHQRKRLRYEAHRRHRGQS